MVDEKRAGIEKEYDEATAIVEIEHGSGFIIQDHFVITNKHVIESALNDDSINTQILISMQPWVNKNFLVKLLTMMQVKIWHFCIVRI